MGIWINMVKCYHMWGFKQTYSCWYFSLHVRYSGYRHLNWTPRDSKHVGWKQLSLIKQSCFQFVLIKTSFSLLTHSFFYSGLGLGGLLKEVLLISSVGFFLSVFLTKLNSEMKAPVRATRKFPSQRKRRIRAHSTLIYRAHKEVRTTAPTWVDTWCLKLDQRLVILFCFFSWNDI